MSAGHHHVHAMGLSGVQLERVLDKESVRERLYRPRQIITSYDMPYVGGYSVDGTNIYLDRHLPEELKLTLDGQTKIVRPVVFLAESLGHEPVEWSVMDALGWDYGHAHSGPATGSERRKVLQLLGPGWWPAWQREIEKYVKADAHEKIIKMPADYDMRPIFYPPVNHKLVTHVEQAMGQGKKSKQEVHYEPVASMPKTRCGNCEYFCKPNSCSLVRGYISDKAWCELYCKEIKYGDTS